MSINALSSGHLVVNTPATSTQAAGASQTTQQASSSSQETKSSGGPPPVGGHRAIPRPVAVRYGWADDPGCNLYNCESPPASPFRSDHGDD